MRNAVLKHLVEGAFNSSSRSRSVVAAATNSSLPFSLFSRRHAVSASLADEEGETVVFPREGPGASYGLNWALAGRGVIVKDKAFYNLKSSELQQKGAASAESLSGLPIHIRGNATGGASEISKAQFSKLLKQVTSHLSSISNVFVHDGAVSSSPKCDAKVRIISDSPSAVLSLSNILWRTPTRAVSHDSCPVTLYAATSISQNTAEVIGLGSQVNTGFLAADVEHSSLILCSKAFSDIHGIKDALAAVAAPIISAREGIPLSARLFLSGDSVILLFTPEDTVQSLSDLLVSTDAGVVLSSQGVAPLFQTGASGAPNLYKLPAAMLLVTSDSSGTLPSVCKISSGQAAYHFLAGYQNGNFVPAYGKGPSPVDPLELAKSLLLKLKENQIPSFLVNIGEGDKRKTGKELVKLVQSILSSSIPPFEPKAGDLQAKYNSFVSGRFQELPEEFSF
ncbi:PREDICTED: uncharacterized protein LOC104587315 [Nelumbo nucifera]|uniref:phosphoenolpyruvate carboxykinase (ATP) n=1 Tax=Nelumbo nucifera TaxID=4432 RepID=A0A1U7Z6M9_NELNU|nr:PREDICTED: uncharacterized protein LOC104587315 [Nelumbo nucifera]